MTHTEASPEPGHQPGQDDGAHSDPLHDIDGPKTTYAIVGTLVLVVGMIWAMSHLFNVFVQVERQTKIGDIVPVELNEIRAAAQAELDGKNPNRGSKTIDDAIAEYLKK